APRGLRRAGRRADHDCRHLRHELRAHARARLAVRLLDGRRDHGRARRLALLPPAQGEVALMVAERTYFLGTHDEELERLGLQHRVWRPTVLECWRRAGIGPGSKVLDVGAGPGFAAADLADIVGPTGRVV